MDDFLTKHLNNWAERNFRDDKETVISRVTAFVSLHPDVIEQGYSWPTILKLANRA